MNVARQRGIGIGLGAVLAVLILSAMASYWNTRQLHKDAGWVAHTHEVLDALQELQTAVTDAETGQRGYLLTADDHYLEPYDHAIVIVSEKIDHLRELTGDNPHQQSHFPQLRQLTAAKLAELRRAIDLKKAGNAAGALSVVKSDEGRRLMAEIRTLLAEMMQEERDLLVVRKPANEQSYIIAGVTGPVAALLGTASLGAYFLLLRRYLRERERAAAVVHEQRELLQATLVSIGDGVIVTDVAGRVTMLNSVAQTLTGWSQEAAQGLLLNEIFHIVNETTRQTVENPALRALREGVIVGLANHTILIARDGRERPIDDSAAPVRTLEGVLAGVVLVFRDITDRKLAEQRLAELLALESERSRRLRRVAIASLALNSTTSTSSVLDVVRAEARDILGADASEIQLESQACSLVR
jgi:PAS domain S-box-containing protein